MDPRSLLLKLIYGYCTSGFFFALAHLALVIWFFYELHRLEVERRVLAGWSPGSDCKTTCTKVLEAFIHENEHLASQGFLIPLTDFTNRLDSVVEGMVGRLHDLINLFLVVGIAGTVFGLFRFAKDPAATVPATLGEALRVALETAFPVVFVGLLLYVGGYVAASWTEKRLRDALTDATERALLARRGVAKSQAALITEALQPLKNLDDTLSHALAPAITKFDESLALTRALLTSQRTTLDSAVGALNTSVQSLREGVTSLQDVAGEVRETLSGLPAALQRIHKLSAEQLARLATLTSTITAVQEASSETIQKLGATADRFSTVFDNFQALPGQLRQQLAASVPELFAGTLEQLWGQPNYEQFFRGKWVTLFCSE